MWVCMYECIYVSVNVCICVCMHVHTYVVSFLFATKHILIFFCFYSSTAMTLAAAKQAADRLGST